MKQVIRRGGRKGNSGPNIISHEVEETEKGRILEVSLAKEQLVLCPPISVLMAGEADSSSLWEKRGLWGAEKLALRRQNLPRADKPTIAKRQDPIS